MTDFLDEKRKEIAARQAELKLAVEEYRRLEAAVAALSDISPAQRGASVGSARAASARRRPGRPRGSATTAVSQSAPASAPVPASAKPAVKRKRGRRKRAGGRAEQALSLIRAEPGITIPALAEKMGIDGTYLYKILPPREQEGKIEKRGRGWYPKAA